MASDAELEQWRQSIRNIDSEILQLIADRMQLAEKVGLHKKRHQLPVKDYRVEKQIIERARTSAQQLGVYPNLAEDVMTTLIKYSVLKQDELKREGLAPQDEAAHAVLIIGGAGHMGQWFAQFYESMGYAVSIYDEKPLSGPTQLYPRHLSLEEGLDTFSHIVLATPMEATNTLLKQLAILKPQALIVEICSLKAPIQTGLDAVLKAGLRIACMHPMFGPDTEILAGKNIVFCHSPGLASGELKQQHYLQTSANLLDISLADHDRLMSYILGASHLMNLVYSQVLARSGEPLSHLKSLAGTTFLKQLEVTSKVVAENQNLYFDIQTLNRSTPQLLNSLQDVLGELNHMLQSQQRQAFRNFMSDAQNYFEEGVKVER